VLPALLGVLLAAAPAGAQALDPGPPGPYVVDVRGVLTGLPSAFIVFPLVPVDAVAPTSAAGLSVGAHVYPLQFGPARLGSGASLVHARRQAASLVVAVEGTGIAEPATEIGTRVTLVEPEVSLNFGTADGWSYLSAGAGWGVVRATLKGSERLNAETGWGPTLHYGGGARWFLNARLAVGFDVRAHQYQGRPIFGGTTQLPRTTLVAATVGFSVR
jgi:hypothetical protein